MCHRGHVLLLYDPAEPPMSNRDSSLSAGGAARNARSVVDLQYLFTDSTESSVWCSLKLFFKTTAKVSCKSSACKLVHAHVQCRILAEALHGFLVARYSHDGFDEDGTLCKSASLLFVGTVWYSGARQSLCGYYSPSVDTQVDSLLALHIGNLIGMCHMELYWSGAVGMRCFLFNILTNSHSSLFQVSNPATVSESWFRFILHQVTCWISISTATDMHRLIYFHTVSLRYFSWPIFHWTSIVRRCLLKSLSSFSYTEVNVGGLVEWN